jgi:Cd(II)/Pb(II)-responsive transcriptional regulator
MERGLRIGELAERTQTPVDTIRYYERVGLLAKPARTASNYRAYSDEAAQRLDFIRRCRRLDMSLDEIRALLSFCDEPTRNCEAVNDVLDENIRHVDQRLEELQRLARDLKQLRSVCRSPGTAQDCRTLRSLRTDAPPTTTGPKRHGRRTHAD